MKTIFVFILLFSSQIWSEELDVDALMKRIDVIDKRAKDPALIMLADYKNPKLQIELLKRKDLPGKIVRLISGNLMSDDARVLILDRIKEVKLVKEIFNPMSKAHKLKYFAQTRNLWVLDIVVPVFNHSGDSRELKYFLPERLLTIKRDEMKFFIERVNHTSIVVVDKDILIHLIDNKNFPDEYLIRLAEKHILVAIRKQARDVLLYRAEYKKSVKEKDLE